jgi:hypothetical protein
MKRKEFISQLVLKQLGRCDFFSFGNKRSVDNAFEEARRAADYLEGHDINFFDKEPKEGDDDILC